MPSWLQNLPIVVEGIVIIGGFVLATLGIGWVVERTVPPDVRREHNELAGFILAVVGVIYAVLLAFVAIGAWERFEAADARTYDEATSLTIVYRDAGSFKNGAALRVALRSYVERVIKDEWPQMRKGERSIEARAALESVARDVRGLDVTSPRLQNIQAQMLAAIDQALQDRDRRISEDATGINAVLWFVLFAGAVVTVAFTYLFGFTHSLMQQLMIGSLSVLIGLVLFLTVAMDYPFRGGLTVGPEAFENALYVFGVIGS